MNEQSPKPSTTTVVLRVLTSTVIAIIATYIILVAILLISVRNDLALPGERFLSQIAPGEVEEEVEEEVDVFDLDSWSTEELVAQILFVMTPSDDTVGFYILARQGIGSIVLSGGNPADDMAEELEYAQHQAPRGIRMLVSSDEEGGEVAYLSKLISGPLPSPPEIATWSSDQIRDATRAYGEKLANLGSHLVLAPALDLTVPGAHMAELDRTFSGDPTKVSEVGIAWMNGMHDAGMSVVLKHWPGIGSAPDTHNTATTIAPLETLEQADLLPFDILIDEGAEMVMVGHVKVPGLTEEGHTIAFSPDAYAYLRERHGSDVIVLTDCLGMGGAVLHSRIPQITEAAILSVEAGSDLVMLSTLDVEEVIPALVGAINEGRIDRAQVENSVRKLLELKERKGLIWH